MTDRDRPPAPGADSPAPPPAGTARRAMHLLRRIPVTISVLLVLVVAGLLSGGFTSPSDQAPWYETFAYGLPSFADGRWYTVATGTVLVAVPPGYLLILPLAALGLGWLELRRGSGVTAATFLIGQAVAVIGTAFIVAGFAAFGSPWADELATQLDVGASGGVFAAITMAAFSLRSPWAGRVLLIVFAVVTIGVLFIGTLADIEHAVAVVAVMLVQARAFSRPTLREQRFITWTVLLAVGAAQVILVLVPAFGPFGASDPGGAQFVDVAIDAVIVLLLADGLRRGIRLAWIGAVVLGALNVLGGVLAFLLLTLLDALGSDSDAAALADSESRDALTLAITTSVLWLGILIWLVITRHAYRARLRRRLPGARDAQSPGALIETARELIRETGGGPLSWMATWPDNRIFLGSDPATAVAYQTHQGVAIALSDPIAPDGRVGETLVEFLDTVERAGFTPCVFGATERARAVIPEGWRAVQIAEDTIVDLPGLEFTGKAWSPARQALNRAEREDVAFRMGALAQQSRRVRAQVDEISAQWVGEKELPEMRFTLGTVDEALDPEVRMAFAERDGQLEGFLSWLPVYGADGAVTGWTLDLMRRRAGGTFPAVMEFLIASSALAFRDEGAAFLSLSGAPLARSTPASADELSPIDGWLDHLGAMLEPAYGFRSLHRFKQKFRPRAEPLYLLFADEGDLARIGLALARAYLPDASMPELVRMGASLTR
ncbi:bifunctional lysylphosphatidylglycerol flippase/synthetase MprF [Agromyces sp. NPDC058104]|uniref:bifunctional lysylphosphatidylglycerol flippase/synthetase MprF n=1 Tax=Agromyces sp. NPDC058104 TaxID=3346342 RepID=UPI0036DCE2AA